MIETQSHVEISLLPPYSGLLISSARHPLVRLVVYQLELLEESGGVPSGVGRALLWKSLGICDRGTRRIRLWNPVRLRSSGDTGHPRPCRAGVADRGGSECAWIAGGLLRLSRRAGGDARGRHAHVPDGPLDRVVAAGDAVQGVAESGVLYLASGG